MVAKIIIKMLEKHSNNLYLQKRQYEQEECCVKEYLISDQMGTRKMAEEKGGSSGLYLETGWRLPSGTKLGTAQRQI